MLAFCVFEFFRISLIHLLPFPYGLPSLPPPLRALSPIHSRRPAHLWSSVGPPIDNFRRCVEWASTKRLQELVLLVQVGKPKVCNLQREARCRELCQPIRSWGAGSIHSGRSGSGAPGWVCWLHGHFLVSPVSLLKMVQHNRATDCQPQSLAPIQSLATSAE